MLSRYTMYRRRPKDAGRLPEGVRKDTRHGTSHVLRPTKKIVEAYLSDASDTAWENFRIAYLAVLEERFDDDKAPFEELAIFATENDVYLGCNCPTKKNPIIGRCHTYLALEFMRKKFPKLKIVVPK